MKNADVHERWASYWSVDFHVHTPGSADAKEENFGTPEEIVKAALDAGLSAIAITDHNTASWCDRITAAALGSDLIVLPGVEITTTEGHLLAVWEEGTTAETINDLLAVLGIKGGDRGKLDIAATVGFADAAKSVVEAGGIAIAAHADKAKGLLGLEVKAHLKRTLLEECLSAVEITRHETQDEVAEKIKGQRTIACVQGSDTWDPRKSRHALPGIGSRRTWIKASRPDLVGIKHALQDPELRIRLIAPEPVAYGRIDSIEISGGFLNGQQLFLSEDLNCLLGGTGAGKSLTLEVVRFALDQQADRVAFPAIRAEVDGRLAGALGENGVVRLEITTPDGRFLVERALSTKTPASPRVSRAVGDEWAEIDATPASVLPIAAFSQGEILEYSRQPVGRMSLVDSGVDFGGTPSLIAETERKLRLNATRFLAARKRVADLEASVSGEADLNEQVRQLAALFDTDTVKAQESWKKEDGSLTATHESLKKIKIPKVTVPPPTLVAEDDSHDDVFSKANTILRVLTEKLGTALGDAKSALTDADAELRVVLDDWGSKIGVFRATLDEELKKIDPDSSLTALRAQLEVLQGKQVTMNQAKVDLTDVARPELVAADAEREALLTALMELRGERREKRRARVAELNAKAAGFVKMDVPKDGDFTDFRRALDSLKTGSRVREDVLDNIARYSHPIAFVRAVLNGDINSIVKPHRGIDSKSAIRLMANIDERDLAEVLMDAQIIDRPDVLTVRFRKPEDKQFAPIEELAHGQRSTAILVIMLADGNAPVLVDQPEDALHAPWIEDYLVDRLRSLRGTRQYIFATRSPGIVVSADAEQIITMRATAGKGQLEASGSLERHDLNKLVLHHLEGGPIAFGRRTMKLAASTAS